MKMREYLRLRNVALSPRDWRGAIPPMNRAERRRAKRRSKKKNTPGRR